MARGARAIGLGDAMTAVAAVAVVFATARTAVGLVLPTLVLLALAWHRGCAVGRADVATGRPATPGRHAVVAIGSLACAAILLYTSAFLGLATTMAAMALLETLVDAGLPGRGAGLVTAYRLAAIVLGLLAGVGAARAVFRWLWPRPGVGGGARGPAEARPTRAP
jgi:hypothetical protein